MFEPHQESLFPHSAHEPLASRIRPQTIDAIVGQEHLLGEGRALRRLIDRDDIPSMILWGPPGVGKTTLAQVIARQTAAAFVAFSAVNSGIKDIKKIMGDAKSHAAFGRRTLVFIDEILRYDKDGEEHYNLISALHKSMRNSDADAAIYWLTRMLEGGEDPLYIARRLIRFASEDIGLADTGALNLTVNVFQACQFIGMPECNVHLTEAVIYLALAPKSNAVYKATLNVAQDVKSTMNAPVPMAIRNGTTKLMRELGYGRGYQLAHHFEDKLTTMQTFPEELSGHAYYFPTEEGREGPFKKRLAQIKAWHREHDGKEE